MHLYGFDKVHDRRISFVFITKNRASLLSDALERAKSLKKQDDELIVVDGGSTDGTHEVVERYKDAIDTFISEPDNAVEAFNKGVLVARGRYVRYLADDDTIYPDRLEEAIALMERHPEIDVLVCGGVNQYGEKKFSFYIPPGTRYGARPEDPFRYKANGTGFIYRRRVFAKIGMTDSVAADIEFIARAIANGAVVKFCRIPLFLHPVHSGSVIISNTRAHRKARLRSAKRYCSSHFYVRYAMQDFLKQYRLFRVSAVYWNRFLKRIGKKGKTGYQWDGGFS